MVSGSGVTEDALKLEREKSLHAGFSRADGAEIGSEIGSPAEARGMADPLGGTAHGGAVSHDFRFG